MMIAQCTHKEIEYTRSIAHEADAAQHRRRHHEARARGRKAAKSRGIRAKTEKHKIACTLQCRKILKLRTKEQIVIHRSNRMDSIWEMTKFRLPGNEEAIPRSQVLQSFPQLT